MKKKSDTTPDAAELRRLAEQRLQKQQLAEGVPQPTDTAMRKLLHELQVHQVELEMQNEELQRARAEADEALARYTDLYDFAPVGYFTLDHDGVILQSNLAGAQMLGVERGKLDKRRLKNFVEGKEHSVLGSFLERVFAGQDRASCELALKGADDTPRQVHIEASAGAAGQTCRAAVTDISGRKRAEEALLESNQRYNRIVEKMPGQILTFHDTKGNFQYVSPNVRQVLGLTPDEFCDHYEKYLTDHPVNREAVRHTELSILGQQQQPYELNIFHKNGGTRWLEVREYPVVAEDGKIIGVEGFATDISERKQAEEALHQVVDNLDERVKELKCLYAISSLARQDELTVDQSMRSIVETIPPAWQFPEITCARITLHDRQYTAGDFRETPWRLASTINADGERVGEIEACYLEERPARDEGPFLREEVNLLNSIAHLVGDITERKQTEVKLAEQVEELRRWNDATLGREMRVIELKREVNELLGQLNQPPRYQNVASDDAQENK